MEECDEAERYRDCAQRHEVFVPRTHVSTYLHEQVHPYVRTRMTRRLGLGGTVIPTEAMTTARDRVCQETEECGIVASHWRGRETSKTTRHKTDRLFGVDRRRRSCPLSHYILPF